MTDKKITALTQGIPTASDIIPYVANPSTTPVTKYSYVTDVYGYKARFVAYKSAQTDNVTGDGTEYTIIFNTELGDVNSNYNNANGVFTAPLTGYYQLNAKFLLRGVSGQTNVGLTIRTSQADYTTTVNVVATATDYDMSLSVLATMSVNETATVIVAANGGSKVCDIYGHAGARTSFSGFMI